MAATIEGLILGSGADGETFSGQAFRLGNASHATVVGDSTAIKSRSGIIPAMGDPGKVTAASATSVTVNPFTVVVQSNVADGGTFTATLTTATVLDTITSDPTNPRIDVLVVEIIADGTGAGTLGRVTRVVGTPNPSPTRPSIATPPTNGHWFPLAQLRVNANGAGIVVTQLTNVDGVFTVAPGGIVPVANLTGAANIPPYGGFILPSGAIGFRQGGAAASPLVMHSFVTRLIDEVVNTNASGEADLTFKYPNEAGTLTNSPFPNAMLACAVMDATPTGTLNGPLILKRQSFGTATVKFRFYNQVSGSFGSFVSASNIRVSGFAMGW